MNGMKRTIGRLAAVGAVALLLAGAVATPAGAMRRSEAIKIVNGFVDQCIGAGGESDVFEVMSQDVVSVLCLYGDGTYDWEMYEYEYEDDDSLRGRADSQSGYRGELALAADDPGDGRADAADRGRHKAHKHGKHKANKQDKHRRHR